MKHKPIYFLFITVFTLVSFEILLRLFHINTTWSEKTGHAYVSGYNQNHPTWFYSWKPNAEFDFDQKDFKYHYKTNSLGIRERDTFYTDSAAFRILCMGDSYTEGFGAPYDSSYPKALELKLNSQGFHNQVYNAGIAASDPFYSYILLKEKLLAARPQYLFITFNSSDITDFIYRGGLERFKTDGTVKGKKSPWFEPLYAKSYVCRFIVNQIFRKIDKNLFLTRNEFRNIACPAAVSQTAQIFDSINQLGKQQGFNLLVIIQPIALEVVNKNKANDFLRTVFLNMEDSLNARQIKTINMWDVLSGKINKTNMAELSYRDDCHFTPSGYHLFAEELLNKVQVKYPTFFANR